MMKKLFYFLLIATLVAMQTGCGKSGSAKKISASDAKAAVSSYSPGAIINDCKYNEESDIYTVEFETDLGKYTASVNGKSGALICVVLTEDEPQYTPEDDDEEPGPVQRLTPDDALTAAILNSDASGSVITVRNDYNRDSNSYTVVFRSGNKEFTYRIDAENGEVLESNVDMDS